MNKRLSTERLLIFSEVFENASFFEIFDGYMLDQTRFTFSSHGKR